MAVAVLVTSACLEREKNEREPFDGILKNITRYEKLANHETNATWLRVDVLCACDEEIYASPRVIAQFDKTDDLVYHYYAVVANRVVVGTDGVSRAINVSVARDGTPFHRLIAEDESTITVEITDFVRGRMSIPGEVKSYFIAVPTAITARLELEVGSKEDQVAILGQSGSDSFWFDPTDFSLAIGENGAHYELNFTADDRIWLQLFPSFEPNYFQGYPEEVFRRYNGSRIEPEYRITGPGIGLVFNRDDAAYRVAESNDRVMYPHHFGEAGQYTISLVFPDDSQPSDRIFPYVVAIPIFPVGLYQESLR